MGSRGLKIIHVVVSFVGSLIVQLSLWEFLFLPHQKYNFRPSKCGHARPVSHQNLIRALAMLNNLLTLTPKCNLFASSWMNVCRECLRFCETIDARWFYFFLCYLICHFKVLCVKMLFHLYIVNIFKFLWLYNVLQSFTCFFFNTVHVLSKK